ncbi:MAG TPA: hypothetical protein PKY40_09280 [Burkholderiaceae bacterium]|nr:hypothetical protein [Burkholderiaceae bacterium]
MPVRTRFGLPGGGNAVMSKHKFQSHLFGVQFAGWPDDLAIVLIAFFVDQSTLKPSFRNMV